MALNKGETKVPEETPATSPLQEVEILEKTPHTGSRKRVRVDGEVVSTYAPQLGVLTTDGVASSVPPSAREVGPDLCRGLAFPTD